LLASKFCKAYTDMAFMVVQFWLKKLWIKRGNCIHRL